MKTVINTDERIFQVWPAFSMGKTILCNLSDIEGIVKESKGGIYKIEHLWNGKFKRISKKALREMLEANRLNSDFLSLV